VVKKVTVAVIASWVYLAGPVLVVRGVGVGLFGSGGETEIGLGMAFSFAACFALGWFNSQRLITALAGTLAAFLAIPLAYLLLSPVTEWLVLSVVPHSNLGLSGSFSAVWFFLAPIIAITVVTDGINQRRRWGALGAGAILVLGAVLAVELFTAHLGQSSQMATVRMFCYAPVMWGGLVLATTAKPLP
jgi:hypothetical protein